MEEKKNVLDEEKLEGISGGNAYGFSYEEKCIQRNSDKHNSLLNNTCPRCGSRVDACVPTEWCTEWICNGCYTDWVLID